MALHTSKKSNKRSTLSQKGQFEKKDIPNESHRGNRLLLIILFILVAFAWIFRSDVADFIKNPNIDTGKELSNMEMLFVGKDIIISGITERSQSSRYAYTHTLEDQTYGILGLRSASTNLYALSGIVYLAGRVTDFENGLYVLEVKEVLPNPNEVPSEPLLFFDTPWIILENIRKDGFNITMSEETSTLLIENIQTNAKIAIRYFSCGTSDTTNCINFINSYASGEQSHDRFGMTFSRLDNQNTRFTTIDEKYGIYIETSHPDLFAFIISKLQFITTKWADQHLSTTAKTSCKEDNHRLKTIMSSNLNQIDTTYTWNIDGKGYEDESIQCQLTFEPLLLEQTKISFTYQTNTIDNANEKDDDVLQIIDNNSNNSTSSTSDNNTINSDTQQTVTVWSDLSSSWVPQFPLKPWKELSFDTRGMKIIFPSPNIAFSSENITSGPNGLNCTAKTNVIEYSHKVNLATNPSVVIYFCTGNISTDNTMKIMNYWDTTVLIQAPNPAWVNFANNITLQ